MGIALQKCVDFLPLKSFNTFGRVLLTLFAFILIIIITIASTSGFSTTSVQCSSESIIKSKTTEDVSIINLKCSLKYQDEFDFILPMNVMFTLNFGIVIVLSIIYGYLVKHRVEKFDNPTGTTASDEENPAMLSPPNIGQNPREFRECLGRFSTFFIYILHLFLSRIIPLLIFACVFYPTHIPNNFHCPWQLDIQDKGTSNFNDTLNLRSNLTIIDCTNPKGKKNKTLVDAVATIDVIFVALSFLELGYIAWLTFNDRNFMSDQEFSMVYLLRKRKIIRKFVNKIRKGFNEEIFELHDDFGGDDISSRSLDQIYVNVVIQEGRERLNAYPEEFERHEIYQSHLETPSRVAKLKSTADIFKPKKGEQSYPRAILVIGRPGIGKTMLTRKLLNQWKVQEDEFWHEKIVILLQFRKFNNKTVTLREMLSFGDGFSIHDFETMSMYNSILLNPTNTILIFDGLDELAVDDELLCENTGNCSPNEKIPMFSILKMLVHGRLLPGVTVLITSRPTAQHLFQNLKVERTVEILGFFEEEIKEYVLKFCPNDNVTSELIWNQIIGSAELLSLCYIPVNSYIVCLTLKESIKSNDSGQQDVGINSHKNIPKTITELYKRAIKVLLYRHHPKYKLLKQRPNDYLIAPFPKELEEDLMKLKEVAENGISEGRLIFERASEDEFGDLANCGLFHKLPDKQRNFFCFLHLTLQEFLAASKVVDDMEKVEQFLVAHVDDPKWHLVIQFIAGLVGDKSREAKMSLKNVTNPKESKKFFAAIEKRLEEWVMVLGAGIKENGIALLGIKCFYELQENDIFKSVSKRFVVKEDRGVLSLKHLKIAPVDSKAFFKFLRNCQNLTQLEFRICQIQGKYSYHKMEKLLCNTANTITSFSWFGQGFTAEGIECLSNVLIGEHCKLTELYLEDLEITSRSFKYLSDAITTKNCKLIKLVLGLDHIEEASLKYLNDAITTKNCKLSTLVLRLRYLEDKRYEDLIYPTLSDVLGSSNCKLTKRKLEITKLQYEGPATLGKAIKRGKWKTTYFDEKKLETPLGVKMICSVKLEIKYRKLFE